MKRYSLLKRFLIWRLKHVSNKNFLIVLSVLIGFAVGIAAVIIKNTVFFIEHLLTQGFAIQYQNYLYFLYPAIGILATVLFIRYVLKKRVGHGIPTVLYSISRTSGIIQVHNMFSSVITSALTVGFGGSVGLEGPTVATGAAIGSNTGRLLHLNYKEITSLLGFACAGAMAAIFKAPIAAIVFVLEVIMLDLTMAMLVPLLTASATAALTSYFFLGQDVLYPFEPETGFYFKDVPYYLIFGVFAGFFSVYFTRMYMSVTSIFEKINKWHMRLLLGAATLGLLIFLFPALYGEGYQAINSALAGDYSYVFDNSIFYNYKNNFPVIVALIIVIALLKVIATSVTFGSGGIGGIFAPTLFIGANAGLFFAIVINSFNVNISPSNFALVGMSGMIAGVIHAPLTAIFLIAEITGGYELFMPLMIVATISYGTVKLFESNSVYTIQLARRGELFTHDKDKAVLSMMKVNKLVERNFTTIHPDATLGDLVNVIAKSRRNLFPVIEEDGTFSGLVFLDDIRHIMFKPELYDNTHVRDLMFMPDTYVEINESMESVAKKFHESGNYNLIVLDGEKYEGCVSRANVFSSYRRRLKKFSEE